MVCQLSRVDIRGNLGEVIDAIKVWLSQPKNMRWPMIYDNYDNPKLTGNTDLTAIVIRKFLLEPYQGSVLSQHGRRKSKSVISSEFESWRMYVIIVLRFYQTHRDEKD